MVHRGAPPFTKPTRFSLGFQLVSSCTALPRLGAHVMRNVRLEESGSVAPSNVDVMLKSSL